MKNKFFSLRPFVRVAIPVILVLTLIGCGFVASVPWIRSAEQNHVVNIGDSIFALSGEIQEFLHAYSGTTFRRYAVSGAELTGGILAPSIASQYNIAKGDNPNIDTILMDGGGNDILLPVITSFDPYNCRTQWYQFGRLSSRCKNFIDDIYVECVDLLNQMAADDVGEVVYLGYYYTKNTWLLRLANLKQAIDYGNLRLSQACDYSAVECTFVDPRPVITNSDILVDAIHPTRSGSEKIANLIYPVLGPRL